MVERYGYFLAKHRLERGDPELAMHCRTIWEALPTPTPQFEEGVGAWWDGAILTIRRVTRNFFTGKSETQDIEPWPTNVWTGQHKSEDKP